MLISVNWLRDFVDLPEDLDPLDLGERFTIRCAEVEGVEPIEVAAQGLIAAGILEVSPIPDTPNLHLVKLDVGHGKTVETVSQAPSLQAGQSVIYAPPGARVAALGEIKDTTVADKKSTGMILPGDALGIALAIKEAVFLDPDCPHGKPGSALPPEWFDDWVIEVDNKSITHRPDLWGHYGIAREVAAIFAAPLKEYPVTPADELTSVDKPELPIHIEDPEMCPRYTGLVMRNLESKPAPLWMQLRLGHVGLRPIDCMVDLTNYIMLELGQPMHAFDGDSVDRIEVALAKPDSKFTTLDGMERTLPENALMILSNNKPVALAGIMGGSETEISPQTQSVLLESANFAPAVIRRCATSLGHRTDASARFEKSLDPAHTILGVQRFVYLASGVWPGMEFASKLSDCYPVAPESVTVEIDPEFVGRYMGQPVARTLIQELLTPLGFVVEVCGDKLKIGVPSYRATKDIAIEADIIEEIARCIGYDNIEPVLPEMTVRSFKPNAMHELEQDTLRLWALGLGFSEIHGYLWYDDDWCKKLAFDPGDCVELRNPVAANMANMRQTLMPGMLAAMEKNRHHMAEFKLIELGTVFGSTKAPETQTRRFAVMIARRQKNIGDQLLAELKGSVEIWSQQVLGRKAAFGVIKTDSAFPWHQTQKLAAMKIGDQECGTVGVVPLSLRRAMDEHLAPWSAAWAEIDFDGLAGVEAPVLAMQDIPAYPEKDLDFTGIVAAERKYEDVQTQITSFEHPLLLRLNYVTSFEGKSLGESKRSLTFRARIGSDGRTLVDGDLTTFRQAFEKHLANCGLELRGG